jgi:hypothetical protein
MTAKSRKPLLANLTWAVALALIGLPIVYVASYLAISALIGVGVVTELDVRPLDDTVYAPILWYEGSGWIGSDTFTRIDGALVNRE